MTVTFTEHFRFGIPDFTSSPWHEDFEALVQDIDRALFNALLGVGFTIWANSTAYTAGRMVISPDDGSLWYALVAHTSAASPTTFAQDRIANPTYWNALGGTSTGGTFLGLTDTPDSYIGQAGKIAVVDGSETGLIFTAGPGGSYNDENAQDAVGGILADTATVDLTYIDSPASISADVKDDSITYAKIQNFSSASKLLGRGTGVGPFDPQEVTLGTNLSMGPGPTLNATGGSGTPSAPFGAIQFNDAGAFGGDVDFSWDKTTNTLGLAVGASFNWGIGATILTNDLGPGSLRLLGGNTPNFIVGSPTTPNPVLTVDADDTNTPGGSGGAFQIDNGGLLTVALGTRSAIFGFGTYDPTTALVAKSGLRFLKDTPGGNTPAISPAGLLQISSDGTISTSPAREALSADRTSFVRADLGACTISIASPAVVTKASHGLVVDDPVVFSLPGDGVTCTITIASPGVVTTSVAHGLAIGDPISFLTTGGPNGGPVVGLPTGITQGTIYFVIAAGFGATTFQFSTTAGGAAVNTSGTQGGIHYVRRRSTLPTGVTEGAVYFVIAAGFGAGSFQFSTSIGGAAVNTSGTQAGKITVATGNDANNGAAATRSGAFLTIQKGINAMVALDLSIYQGVIQLADSTYLSTSFTTDNRLAEYVGTGPITIRGVSSGLAKIGNYRIQGSNFAFQASAVSRDWVLEGIELNATNYGILCDQGSLVRTKQLSFGSCASGCIFASNMAKVTNELRGGYSGSDQCAIWASTQFYCRAYGKSEITQNFLATFPIPINLTVPTFLQAESLSLIICSNSYQTVFNSMIGKKFDVKENSVISGGATQPGNAAGTTATGGISV